MMGGLFVVVQAKLGFAQAVEAYFALDEAQASAAGMILACDFRDGEDDVQIFYCQPDGRGSYLAGCPMLRRDDVEMLLASRAGSARAVAARATWRLTA
jgi:hypothetical protein